MTERKIDDRTPRAGGMLRAAVGGALLAAGFAEVDLFPPNNLAARLVGVAIAAVGGAVGISAAVDREIPGATRNAITTIFRRTPRS